MKGHIKHRKYAIKSAKKEELEFFESKQQLLNSSSGNKIPLAKILDFCLNTSNSVSSRTFAVKKGYLTDVRIQERTFFFLLFYFNVLVEYS